MKTPNILVVGDIMLDHYLWGSADRISPEAPVPVVNVKSETFSLGGAANVAHNLSALDIKTCLLGPIGKDKNGSRIQKLLVNAGIEDACIVSEMKTTSKVRVVSQRHQMIRLDWEETFKETDVAIRSFSDLVNSCPPTMILVSDYAKGVCSPEFMSEILAYSKQSDIPVLIDPKGKDWRKYQGAYLVKPNLKELEDIAGTEIPNEDLAIEKMAKEIMVKYAIENLVITRSSKGISVITDSQSSHIPAIPVDVFDVSGAGDTVLAELANQLSKRKDLIEATHAANKAASDVVSKFGVVVCRTKT